MPGLSGREMVDEEATTGSQTVVAYRRVSGGEESGCPTRHLLDGVGGKDEIEKRMIDIGSGVLQEGRWKNYKRYNVYKRSMV